METTDPPTVTPAARASFVPIRRPAEPADGSPVVVGFGGPVTNELPPQDEEALFSKYTWIVDQAVVKIPQALLASASLEADDLRQEGLMGLLTAARTFDRSRSARFSPYARTVVANAIYGALRSNDPLAEGARRDLKMIAAYQDEHEQRFHTSPTLEQIAEGTGISADRIRNIRRQATILTAMQAQPEIEDGSDPTVPTVLERLEESEIVQELGQAWRALDERSQRVLRWRVVEGRTVREVAKAERLSIGRVSQIQAKALQTLKGLLLCVGACFPSAPILFGDIFFVAKHVL